MLLNFTNAIFISALATENNKKQEFIKILCMNDFYLELYDKVLDKEDFFTFCKNASKQTNLPAHKNMWNNDWQNCPETLPYLLEVNKRFSPPTGQFFILKHLDKIIACSGIYQSYFSSDVVIAGVRTWTDSNYKNQTIHGNYLLPAQKLWAINLGYKIIALSFNDYNKNIIEIFKRRRLGEVKDRLKLRKQHHLFYNGLHTVEFPVTIQHTKQWIIYEKLDDNWNFDWSKIKFEEN